MYNIIGTMRYWVTLSAGLFVLSIIFWFMWGLNLGIDFTGGTSMQVSFPTKESVPATSEIQQVLEDVQVSYPHIQTAGEQDVIIKSQSISNEQRQQFLDQFAEKGIVEQSFSSVGSSLGSELKEKAVISLLLVLLSILGFITYAFRKISHAGVPSWVFGVGAIIALFHDVIITIGVFIVLGHFFGVQIDSYFVTALLIVLGFSVNDTIVVYDRIRENLKHRGKKSFSQIINESINTTLARSLNTSLTALLVLIALYLFGGESIRYFVLALMCGILFGAYSSIFIASPILLFIERLLNKNRS